MGDGGGRIIKRGGEKRGMERRGGMAERGRISKRGGEKGYGETGWYGREMGISKRGGENRRMKGRGGMGKRVWETRS